MKKLINRQTIIPTLVCLIPFVLSAIFYHRLPLWVAIHFTFSGVPDSFAPRAVAAFVLPGGFALVHLFMLFRMASDPKKDDIPSRIKLLTPWYMPVLSILAYVLVLTYALTDGLDIMFYTCIAMGLLITVLGNFAPKCRHNYTVGIKTPWTLADENNWNHTHRISGYIYVVCGFLLMLNAITSFWWFILLIIALIVVLPPFISYLYYRKHGVQAFRNVENEGDEHD